MRRYLRIAAISLGLLCAVLWVVLGSNRGWTKTTRTTMMKDLVTDIDYPVVEKRFSPGLECLGGGLFVSLLLVGISFGFKPKPKH